MKKIIIASDSFKGSLSSAEVAVSCEKGIRKVFPKCEIIKLPIADGGEGTIEALVSATNGRIHSCHVHDPLMRLIEARYGVLGDVFRLFCSFALQSYYKKVKCGKI